MGRRVLYCADVTGEGGGPRHRDAVIANLRHLGFEVEVVHGVAGVLRRGRARAGTSARRPLVTSLALLANSMWMLCVLWRRASAFRPDVLLWRPGFLQFHATVVARRLRIPLVLEVNAPLTGEAQRFRDYRWHLLAARLERSAAAAATRIIGVSEAAVDWIGPDDRVRVVPNGGGYLDAAEAEAAEAWGAAHCPVCAGPGDRRWAMLLESFRVWHGDDERRAALEALDDGWGLLVVGDGPAREGFLRWAEGAGLQDRLLAMGRLPAHAVQHLLARHTDLGLVLYPKLETFYFSPLKLYDFLAHGVTTVATDIGQVGEVARGPHAPGVALVAAGDLDAVRRTVREAAGRPPAARSTVPGVLTSPFSWPAAVAGYAAALMDGVEGEVALLAPAS